VHALRNIHAALAPDALLVDTQPLSLQPRVVSDDAEIGTLDMRAWVETIRAVDARFAETLAAGLFDLLDETRFVVTESFDDGPECLETVSVWRDTRVPQSLASKLDATNAAVRVEQDVRLRLLHRATPRHNY